MPVLALRIHPIHRYTRPNRTIVTRPPLSSARAGIHVITLPVPIPVDQSCSMFSSPPKRPCTASPLTEPSSHVFRKVPTDHHMLPTVARRESRRAHLLHLVGAWRPGCRCVETRSTVNPLLVTPHVVPYAILPPRADPHA